jgi:hypothetical protein
MQLNITVMRPLLFLLLLASLGSARAQPVISGKIIDSKTRHAPGRFLQLCQEPYPIKKHEKNVYYNTRRHHA